MAKNSNEYDRNYYRDVRQPKTAGFRAVAAATCPICGDEWASTHAGYDSALFVCNKCSDKLSNWEREKEMARRKREALCQVCGVEPIIALHEASQLRCCVGCIAWLSEGDADGRQRWEPAKADPWDEDGKLGHLFEQVGAQFHEPPAVVSLCGVKAPIAPLIGDMMTPAALRRWGLCIACLSACPEPVGVSHWDRGSCFAYVIPVGQAQEIAPVVGTS